MRSGVDKKNKSLHSRRDFLKTGGMAAGAAAIAGPLFGGKGQSSDSIRTEQTVGPFELDEKSILDLQGMMESGEETARSITEKYLARIREIDKQGPAVNAVIELNPDALDIAGKLDAERRDKGPRGPMHGIPILIKDNIDTADRITTTAGSLALEGAIPARDAFIVQRLRDAGVVLLGKTNLSEWANFRSNRSSSGWSGRGGQTRNPYALDRNPCGSSSGSGAAVSASLCAAAIGTETDGSIVCPSSTNGIVGIKPTLGLISRSGIIPIAHSQDTAGPMARTVSDAAILLGALTGMDPLDSATAGSIGKSFPDYAKFLDRDGLKGARIGVARKFFGFHEKVDKLMEEAIQIMKGLGVTVVDPADIPTTGKFDDSEYEILLYEFKADLNKYLAGLGPDARAHSLKEIIEFNEKNRDREMPFFEQEIFLQAEAKGTLSSKAYRKALSKNHRLSRKEGIDKVMGKYRLDALIAPTGGPAWPIDLINGDHFSGGCSTPAAVAGYPHVTVPAGFVFGLPVGISFFGRAYTESTLIRLAFAFEQATRHRAPPKFLPVVDLKM